MNIERFKQQHKDILRKINELRHLSRAGVAENSVAIADGLRSLTDLVTRHLAVEDRILYPMVQRSPDKQLADMGQRYQEQMGQIATPFITFSRQYSDSAALLRDPEGFRAAANIVIRRVYERMQQEDREFYPAIETSQ